MLFRFSASPLLSLPLPFLFGAVRVQSFPYLSLSSLLLAVSLRIPAYLFRIGAFLVIAIHGYSVSAHIHSTPRFAFSKRSQSTPSPFNRSVPIPLLCFSSLCSSVSVRFSLLLRSSVSTPVYTIPLPCVSFLCSSLSFHGLAIQFHCLAFPLKAFPSPIASMLFPY